MDISYAATHICPYSPLFNSTSLFIFQTFTVDDTYKAPWVKPETGFVLSLITWQSGEYQCVRLATPPTPLSRKLKTITATYKHVLIKTYIRQGFSQQRWYQSRFWNCLLDKFAENHWYLYIVFADDTDTPYLLLSQSFIFLTMCCSSAHPPFWSLIGSSLHLHNCINIPLGTPRNDTYITQFGVFTFAIVMMKPSYNTSHSFCKISNRLSIIIIHKQWPYEYNIFVLVMN